jgi:hypothetical protein
MFRENKNHSQISFFESTDLMNPRIKDKLEKSWAPIFYEHVFCKIDEQPFAVLYSDIGSPNFPVNIVLSLEFIKHFQDYSDDELIENFYFNYLVNYAVGNRTLGELNLAEKTLYNFRFRVYRYTLANPDKESLVFGQFLNLLNGFLKEAGISAKEQRMDSTLFMSNIKKAGRISLAFDVLVKAIKTIPEVLLPENLKEVLKPAFKTETLYKTKPSESDSKLDVLLNLCAEAKNILENSLKQKGSEALRILNRFLSEQANFDESAKQFKAKSNKEISASSLQSAYDEDATYRTKGKHSQSGYVLNIAETCAKENPVQLITDYKVDQNIISDVELIEERLPIIKENTGCDSFTTDGGFYGDDVVIVAKTNHVEVHFTDMTGRNPSEKLAVTEFEMNTDTKIIEKCPEGYVPEVVYVNKNQTVAHFPLEICSNCERRELCRVKEQKKSYVVRINHEASTAAEQRAKIQKEYPENISTRAAIEGTNSALKRRERLAKLRVRGQAKCTVVVGYKIIARNFRQFCRYMLEQAKVLPFPEPVAVARLSWN